MKTILQIIALIALTIVAVIALAAANTFKAKEPLTGLPDISGAYFRDTAGDLIHVAFPLENAVITSPLAVSGEARGNWYFEASFPVMIVDWDGRIIAQEPVQANPLSGGSWMTTEYVPFEGALSFTKPECAAGADYCKRGAVIFKKDNPSGLPENDAAVEVPILFE